MFQVSLGVSQQFSLLLTQGKKSLCKFKHFIDTLSKIEAAQSFTIGLNEPKGPFPPK